MGVLNVTPDSFSDGGLFLDFERRRGARSRHGRATGADIVDVGGESSRPGAEPVAEGEELRRVVPVIEALSAHVRVSVDTVKRAVAEAAVGAGATLVNDISASLWPVAAEGGVGWVAMHMQGEPRTMQDAPSYDDVVAEVRRFLVERATAARVAGVHEVFIDPGIGFGKTTAHNLALLNHLPELVADGFPVLVGTSRKSVPGPTWRRHRRGSQRGWMSAWPVRWPPPRGPCWRGRPWSGSTTCPATVQAAALVGPTRRHGERQGPAAMAQDSGVTGAGC